MNDHSVNFHLFTLDECFLTSSCDWSLNQTSKESTADKKIILATHLALKAVCCSHFTLSHTLSRARLLKQAGNLPAWNEQRLYLNTSYLKRLITSATALRVTCARNWWTFDSETKPSAIGWTNRSYSKQQLYPIIHDLLFWLFNKRFRMIA